MAEALSCLRVAFGAAVARLQEEVLEVDSDRCIMTYMGKMKEGWYACYRQEWNDAAVVRAEAL